MAPPWRWGHEPHLLISDAPQWFREPQRHSAPALSTSRMASSLASWAFSTPSTGVALPNVWVLSSRSHRCQHHQLRHPAAALPAADTKPRSCAAAGIDAATPLSLAAPSLSRPKTLALASCLSSAPCAPFCCATPSVCAACPSPSLVMVKHTRVPSCWPAASLPAQHTVLWRSSKWICGLVLDPRPWRSMSLRGPQPWPTCVSFRWAQGTGYCAWSPAWAASVHYGA